jgi:hypothetical protein
MSFLVRRVPRGAGLQRGANQLTFAILSRLGSQIGESSDGDRGKAGEEGLTLATQHLNVYGGFEQAGQ